MQVEQTTDDGLKRAYAITIPASEIEDRVLAEVKKIAPQVKMPGFRPGKVPANLVRKMHGEQIHAQVVNEAVQGSVDSVIKERELRPAMQPTVTFGEGYEQGGDATLTVALEVLPQVEAPPVEGLKLDRLTVPVTDQEVEERLQAIAGQQKSYKDAAKTRKAKAGDQLIVDFTGRIDGEEFEGGKAEDAALVLGSGSFIPGFEEALEGVKTGEEKTIAVTFPEDYQAAHLAGKEAEFDVVVKAVKVETETELNDEFATNLGLESLDKLKELVRGQLEQETAGLTRTAMKRGLLDQLAEGHDFPVPEGMVNAEFEQIWQQLTQEAEKEDDPEKAKAEIEAEKDDYRRIAERRVRLGLLLSEIGQTNGVEITGQEMSMLIQQAAQQYREEDRQRFVEYIQNEPMAAAQLRAPLYEDKVVDFLFDKADVTEREVTREELQAAIEAEENDEAEAKPAAKKAPAKKAVPKKKPAAKKDDGETKPKKAPAKKAKKDEDSETKPVAKKAAPKKKAATRKAPAKKDEAG